MKKEKVPVTKRALIQRINRTLAKQEEQLHTSKGERSLQDLGEYYVLNVRGNYVLQKDVDLEELGRELGVLKPFEALQDG